MATKLIILVILVIVRSSLEDVIDNKIQIEDVNPIDEAKADILKEQNAQNIGGMLNNLMHSDGAKQLGDMLMNAAAGEQGGQMLENIGSMLGQGLAQGQGLDPSLLGAAMSMLQQGNKKGKESFDFGSIFSLLGALTGQGDEKINVMGYIPMLLQTFNAFLGPEAAAREKSHSGHAGLMPPLLEKIHLLFDHFMNSDLGKKIVGIIGAQKFVKVFADENGKFSYRKFVDMLENHSFRKHWISMITNRIAKIISYFSDTAVQKKYLTTFQHFLNSILKSQGYPKATLFDINRPTETLSNLINYVVKQSLNVKINSKQYVKPAVEYVQELFNLAHQRGIVNVDHRQLSDKLADTINLEVIEPIARVNRAYRFARKVPKCDRYVMCLVNQEPQDEKPTLPGLRPLLSKSASLILSWFLSGHTGTSFWSLYNVIMDENNCQARFLEACNDFHIEEIKVTTEYVHNEL